MIQQAIFRDTAEGLRIASPWYDAAITSLDEWRDHDIPHVITKVFVQYVDDAEVYKLVGKNWHLYVGVKDETDH
jgi:hypothetical protein